MKKKILVILLALTFVVTLLPIAAFASYSDTGNHWARAAIEKWSSLGILQGHDGKFRPETPITRGEMAVIIDRLMDYQTAVPNSFKDLGQDFYTDAVLKANKAGIITDYAGMIRPTAEITREEAAVMLGRALGLAESATGSGYTDSGSFSSWAVGYINAMTAKGFINGYNGKFDPKAPITRAETVTILDNAIKGLYSEAKEFTGTVTGTVIVNKSGVVLKNMTISGDLIIAPGVADGDVTLTNVVVMGNTIVRGGGANSIHINGTSQLGAIIIEKTDDGQIRIVTADGAVVDAVYVNDGNDDIILTGAFESVTIAAGVKVKAIGAHVDTVNITAEGGIFETDSASTVGLLIADAPSTVNNSGTITKAEINANDVVLNGNKPLKVAYAEGVQGATDTGGGGGISNVAVSAITITGVNGVTGVLAGSTLQMHANITPSNATNKSVTWAVTNGTGTATIDLNGLLTATGAGTVTVKATANDGSNVYGETVIYITDTLDLVTLSTENFNTHKSTDYVGINVGWDLGLTNLNLVTAMEVQLFDAAGNKLATNTGVMEYLRTVSGGKFSTPFFVAQGTYKAADDHYWSFGTWTPAVGTVPAKAVIKVTDVYGTVYTAENTSLQAANPSHPTWAQLFEQQDLVSLTAENFNTHKSTDYVGINVGWNLGLTNLNLVTAMEVQLFDAAGNKLATNTGVMEYLRTVSGGKFSTPFFVAQGTYKAADDHYWSFGTWTPAVGTVPAKAVIKVTDVYGTVYTAENASLQATNPSHPTWAQLFDQQNLVSLTAENFNTHKSTDYVGINVGWNLGSTNLNLVTAMEVQLFDAAGNKLAANTGVMEYLKTVSGGKFSTPFFVAQGTYKAADDHYWSFGTWTPAVGTVPAKAVIKVTDVYGTVYTAENTNLQAANPSHPTWAQLFEQQNLVSLTAENFNTHKSTDYVGINVGWNIGSTDINLVSSMIVELYDSENHLMAKNTGVMSELKKVGGSQFSTPYFVKIGTYPVDPYWTFGTWEPVKNISPAKAVITLTDVYGREYTVSNNSLAAEPNKAWTDLFTAPEFVVTVLSSTRSNMVDVSKSTINNFGWFAVKLDSLLDLSAGSKGNFIISYEYSTDNGVTWEKAKKADGTVFFKDKSWTGYLNNVDGSKVGSIVPAGVIIDSNETKVGDRATNAYNAIIAPDSIVMVRTVLNITDNYGNNLPTIKLDPVTFTNSVPDNIGIDIYDKVD